MGGPGSGRKPTGRLTSNKVSTKRLDKVTAKKMKSEGKARVAARGARKITTANRAQRFGIAAANKNLLAKRFGRK